MNDLSNSEKLIFEYLKTILSEAFPQADLRDESEFMETFALPHVKLFDPLLRYTDRLKLMQSLENASLLTVEEMDEMTANYYNPRKPGLESDGSVTFVLSDLPDDIQLDIPAFSIEVKSKSGLLFRNTERFSINETTAPDYYNPLSYNYKITLAFESISAGSENNVGIYEINECTKGQPKNFIECYNESPFINGQDLESNERYAARLQEEMFAPNLGVERGYKRFLSSFGDVRDSLIVGYGHPLMKRDVIGQVEVPGVRFAESIKDLHWGTKVDVYLRGQTETFMEEILPILQDDRGLYVQINYVPLVDVIQIKKFSYSAEYDDANIEESSLTITDYNISRDEDFETFGTLEEQTKIYLTHPTIASGQSVRIEYRYNALLQEIHNRLYETAERPPTADVKLKEAHKKALYGSMVVRMWSATGLRDNNRNYIRNKLADWVDQKVMGDEIQFSTLLTPLTSKNEEFTESIIEYIHLPYQFVITDHEHRYLFYTINEKKRSVLEYFRERFAPLHAIFERYKDVITTYDFFDFFHATTSNNQFELAKLIIDDSNEESRPMYNAFVNLREMVAKAQAVKRLSPAVFQIEEYQYYELGDLYLYEDYTYTDTDWRKMIENLMNLSFIGKPERDMNDYYRLALYFLVMMKIFTEPSIVERPDELIVFVTQLAERTPIASEFE